MFKVKGLNEAIKKFETLSNNINGVMMKTAVLIAEDLKNKLESAKPEFKGKVMIVVKEASNSVWLGPELSYTEEIEEGKESGWVEDKCAEWKYRGGELRKGTEAENILSQLAWESEAMIQDMMGNGIRNYVQGLF